MKIWISKNTEVPIHDQLVAQIMFGIASGDLAVGERLPSTRELARRFRIHQNTVSAAYRELAARGLVNFKKGSGVYVAETNQASPPTLDALFARFQSDAIAHGYSQSEIREATTKALAAEPARRLLLVESDGALGEIIAEEIRAATGLETAGIMFEDLSRDSLTRGTQLVAMNDEKPKIEKLLPQANCIFLHANSVANSMTGQIRPTENDLIAIVSGWKKFISFAKLYLIAANVDPRTVIERSTAERGWQKGIEQATVIICDSLAAKKLSEDKRLRVFPLIAPASMRRLIR
jgi:DNA-binding transcriptional regulator YhcF (GntR family)